jgi:DNA-binding SARP family transcriptional activator
MLAPLERNLLAVLALSKGTVISTERIIDCLWGDRHPASPRSRVQGLISTLRRKVGEALVTRHPGYQLDAAGTTIDLDECEDLVRQGRQARSPGETAQYLRKALSLWRGEPLDGVSAPGIEVDRTRLSELRVGLLEERYDAELEVGNHAEMVGELTATVSANPLRERLAGQLMLALYRCNRQADALKTYQALRERLAEELGSDPCADLRNLHATILRGEQVYQPQAEPVTDLRPAQLPASVGHFTGRENELATLTRVIKRQSDEPRVLIVSGAGGLGKTALVVRWAHSIAELYPDGQIFLDLHGHVPGAAMPAGNALAVVLAALGVAKGDIPVSDDERAALYRTLISGKRVLLIADDVSSVNQLLPLVPPTTASQLVVTSRRRLVVLAAHHAVQALQIEPLSTEATYDLLSRIAGPERLRDPAAGRVVQWCGGWPLEIRLTGTKLAARPWQSLTSFADELADQLDDPVLGDDPRSVRAALAGAYELLSPAAAHLFGRLGRYPGSSLCLQTTAAEADISVRKVRQLFDELIAVHLVVEDGPDRYRFHDIVRRFARQCAAELVDRDAVDEWMRQRVADSYRI